MYFCMVNYWILLMFIGFYKCTVLESPSMDIKEKSQLATR